MNAEDSIFRVFHQSLIRATADPAFFQRFYQGFVADSPEIAAIFHDRDMERIHKKLKTTLEMVADNAADKPGLGMYLEMLGRIHERLNIHPVMFTQWRSALIQTAEDCDPEFNESIRQAWCAVIDDLMAKMQEKID